MLQEVEALLALQEDDLKIREIESQIRSLDPQLAPFFNPHFLPSAHSRWIFSPPNLYPAILNLQTRILWPLTPSVPTLNTP